MNATIYKLLGTLLVTAIPAILSAQEEAPPPNPPTLPPLEKPETEKPDFSTPIVPLAAPTTEWVLHKTEDGAHPDGNEQAMVWLMNRARSNPTKEGANLAGIDQANITSNYNIYGVDLEKMQNEFAAIEPMPPAAFDRRIYEGSRVHSEEVIARNEQGHFLQFEKVADAGFMANGASASVFSASQDALHAHAGFNVDWGTYTSETGEEKEDGMQEGRGHRVGLMSDLAFALTNVGIAMLEESDPTTTKVGPLVTSITYARAYTFSDAPPDHFNVFIVGTVWDDDNGNGLYDSGEGISDVTVMPNTGTYFAITGDAGGFAIPVAADGVYRLTFTGDGLPDVEERTVTIEGESVLVVWNPTDSYNGLQPLAPDLTLARSPDGIVASWAIDTDMEYALETSTDGVTWDEDPRTITIDEGIGSFLVSFVEIESTLLFRLVVTAADTSESQ